MHGVIHRFPTTCFPGLVLGHRGNFTFLTLNTTIRGRDKETNEEMYSSTLKKLFFMFSEALNTKTHTHLLF